MAFVIAAIATTAVIGIPAVLLVDRHARGAALVGLSYLYGAGVVWATMFALSLLHVAWTATTTTAALVLCSAAMWSVVVTRRAEGLDPEVGGQWAVGSGHQAHLTRTAHIVDLATAYTVVTFAMYATIARVWEWDFWAIWGLKARVFFEAGGVDWTFLRSPFNDFTHPDYPLLVQLNDAYAALVSGQWDDRWLGLLGVASAAALLLIVRSLAAREAGAFTASLLTLASTAFVLCYVGLAESPFIAYATAAVLFTRRAVLFEDTAALRHGAILLGLAASTKNEGLALIACVAVAVALCRSARSAGVSPAVAGRPAPGDLPPSERSGAGRRIAAGETPALQLNVLKLWPAVAIAAPWLLTRAILHLTTDITRGSFVSRVLERLSDTPLIVRALSRWMPDSPMWFLMLAGLLVIRWDRRLAERFVLTVVLLQLAVYVAAYFGSPRGIEWHIETSWPRVAKHVAAPLLYVVMIALARTFSREETLPHAEARPELS
jgi:hypothetical protein